MSNMAVLCISQRLDDTTPNTLKKKKKNIPFLLFVSWCNFNEDCHPLPPLKKKKASPGSDARFILILISWPQPNSS